MKSAPKVGQRLYCRKGGWRPSDPSQPMWLKVSKVGRKYFTAETEDQYRFEYDFVIETWREKHDSCSRIRIYESEQEYLDEIESRSICGIIWKSFDYGKNTKNLPLEALRKINAIIQSQV